MGKHLITLNLVLILLYMSCTPSIEFPVETINPPDEGTKIIGCDWINSTLIIKYSESQKGFNYDYLLFIPQDFSSASIHRLLVIPNNSGKYGDIELMKQCAINSIKDNWEGTIARKLNIPVLVPIFPRSKEINAYTHVLDRNTMLITNGQPARLDLQLMAMIDDAKDLLYQYWGIILKEKIFMSGVSGSGFFSMRFTALHPEIIKAIAVGAICGMPILPISEMNGLKLFYPIGIDDFESLIGKPFLINDYKKVSQYIYMGAMDTNDMYVDWSGEWHGTIEDELVWNAIGRGIFDRWPKAVKILSENSKFIQTHTYPEHGHDACVEDIVRFLRSNDSEGFHSIKIENEE